MKKAIITGATGLVGSYVSKYLANNGIEVLCLGRKQLNNDEIRERFGSNNIEYLSIRMEDILSLSSELQKINWIPGKSCVFYNFAWGGSEKLTDGNFQDQFNNVIRSANAVLSAKEIGCIKFINSGTLEETYAEFFLNDTKNNPPYSSSQTDYAIAKLASRDMNKMVSYLQKIDYIHTRLSVPLDPELKKGGYISSVLRKIKDNLPYEIPKNKQLYDLILLEDVAKAYHLIGIYGKNKSDYFIGTSKPKTLQEYFEISEKSKKGNLNKDISEKRENSNYEFFSIMNLVNDTGFKLSYTYEEFIKSLHTS